MAKMAPKTASLVENGPDPRAVAKQQIFTESVKNEMKHLTKNRTTDFVLNPTQGKLLCILTLYTS